MKVPGTTTVMRSYFVIQKKKFADLFFNSNSSSLWCKTEKDRRFLVTKFENWREEEDVSIITHMGDE